ncbi:hydrogenase expression/formation protein HypE [Thiomicrorhabdus sp.]|uniref:hydrogenase expression/formation protein HypE n=1 Tax=Thiomicrorhabdus sp. TaxID=2039724 RepID=UPI0029C73D32|nr:hydrogenase expression/formation protein HypE [Thiomicrorhabdus sp.]
MKSIETFKQTLIGRFGDQVITLAHGSGGKAMQQLIDEVILPFFGKPSDSPLEDQARLPLPQSGRLCMTTDSYVVTPIRFPGSSIGHLAINGTVNDLAVSGAQPLYLSCGLIIEEGLAFAELIEILADMAVAAQAADVQIVTGDTKVVDRGSCDKLFINTAGVGVLAVGMDSGITHIQTGDKVLINGDIGDHGVAILAARGELALETTIESDCSALTTLIQLLLAEGIPVHAMRDVTRGGLATVLNEYAQGAGVGILIDEGQIPIKPEVRGVCEVLGLDPLYLANEGKVALVVPADFAEQALQLMRSHPSGINAAMVAEVVDDHRGRVVMQSDFGGKRVVDMLVGEQLPRIC